MLNGQAIANADTAWPELWALPATTTWRSGTTLTLPDMADRLLQGGSAGVGAPGVVGGANSRSLVAANMPIHNHTIVHTHEFNHNHTIAHTHTMAHNHAAGTTSTAPDHTHGGEFSPHALTTGGLWLARRIADTGTTPTTITAPAGAHAHTFDVAAFTGNTGAASTSTSGVPSTTTTGGANPATSGNAGSGSAFDVRQAYLKVNYMIKAAT